MMIQNMNPVSDREYCNLSNYCKFSNNFGKCSLKIRSNSIYHSSFFLSEPISSFTAVESASKFLHVPKRIAHKRQRSAGRRWRSMQLSLLMFYFVNENLLWNKNGIIFFYILDESNCVSWIWKLLTIEKPCIEFIFQNVNSTSNPVISI